MSEQAAFLEQEIELASPAKLRWLLLRKAHGVCAMVDQFIKKEDSLQAKNWMILVLDILNELLQGVTDHKNPSAKAIADLYVYLIKETYAVIEDLDVKRLQSVYEILGIELATWEMVVQKEQGQNAIASSSHHPIATPHFSPEAGFDLAASLSSLNLEA